MQPEELAKLPDKIGNLFYDMQNRVFQDIIRRIYKTGEITSTADYQLERLRILGNSSEFIESEIKRLLDATYPEVWELYDRVVDSDYVRNKDLYEQINAKYIPYEYNDTLQSWVHAAGEQTSGTLENITRSLGFSLDYGGKLVFTPFSEYYQKYLDRACMDIVAGVFDYNTVLRRVVTELTNSGMRTIDYASGRTNRMDVAARRAIMTGVNQLSAKMADKIGEDLGTDSFEVTWHTGARPSHWWGGMVFTREGLVRTCGLGEAGGLCGANCRHSYHAFIPGVSVRTYTDDELNRLAREEAQTKAWKGKEYNAYQATQKQRKMETAMRAQREKVDLLKAGDADPDDIMLARAKYQGQLGEYAQFCKKMGLEQQRERIYMDMRGRVAPSKETAKRYSDDMIKNASRDKRQYERYKNLLGDDAGSLAEFRQMKYNDSEQFELLKDYVRSVKNGMVSPLSGFANYVRIYNEIDQKIVGIKTSEGETVVNQSKHFIERVIGTMEDPKTKKPRSGVTVDEIKEALKTPIDVKPLRTDSQGRSSQKYIGEKATVTVNPESGELIQCNPTDSDMVRRIKNVGDKEI